MGRVTPCTQWPGSRSTPSGVAPSQNPRDLSHAWRATTIAEHLKSITCIRSTHSLAKWLSARPSRVGRGPPASSYFGGCTREGAHARKQASQGGSTIQARAEATWWQQVKLDAILQGGAADVHPVGDGELPSLDICLIQTGCKPQPAPGREP